MKNQMDEDNCKAAKYEYERLKEQKAFFDKALAEGIKTGDFSRAKSARRNIESWIIGPFYEKELGLREQYDSQIEIYKKIGLLRELHDGKLGIKVDGRSYPLPSFFKVMRHLKNWSNDLVRQDDDMYMPGDYLGKGYRKLLLVPFAMSPASLIELLNKRILEGIKDGRLGGLDIDSNNPVAVISEQLSSVLALGDSPAGFVYHRSRFDSLIKSQPKRELTNESGWSIFLAKEESEKINAKSTVGSDTISLGRFRGWGNLPNETYFSLEDCLANLILKLETKGASSDLFTFNETGDEIIENFALGAEFDVSSVAHVNFSSFFWSPKSKSICFSNEHNVTPMRNFAFRRGINLLNY